MRRVAEALVHPALARRDGDAGLGAQAVEGDDDLLAVAAADAVGNDVDGVAGVAQVQRRLGDADVRLDADEGDLGGSREVGRERGHQHRELGLVNRRRGQVRGDGGHGRAQLGGRLRRCVDRHGRGLGKGEELLGGGDAVVVVVVSLGAEKCSLDLVPRKPHRLGGRESGREKKERTPCQTRGWHCETFLASRKHYYAIRLA